MSLIPQLLLLSIAFLDIHHTLTPNEWHRNTDLNKEYYYHTNCVSEFNVVNMTNKCIELGGDNMASIPTSIAMTWFKNELITSPPNTTCTSSNIAFGAIDNFGPLSSGFIWFNGDTWDDTLINWQAGCGEATLPKWLSPFILYMSYPAMDFCDATIADTYSIVCERSIMPTESPSTNPTTIPSVSPTIEPTQIPSSTPSNNPSVSPSKNPTDSPSNLPSIIPSNEPTSIPSQNPSYSSSDPSNSPSIHPSISPTMSHTDTSSALPSDIPTASPSITSSETPSQSSNSPSVSPSKIYISTSNPTYYPSMRPTNNPTLASMNTIAIIEVETDQESETSTTSQTVAEIDSETDNISMYLGIGDILIILSIACIFFAICLSLIIVIKRRRNKRRQKGIIHHKTSKGGSIELGNIDKPSYKENISFAPKRLTSTMETREQVKHFLLSIDRKIAETCYDKFIANGWDTMNSVCVMDNEDLKEMDILPGKRKLILHHIQKLQPPQIGNEYIQRQKMAMNMPYINNMPMHDLKLMQSINSNSSTVPHMSMAHNYNVNNINVSQFQIKKISHSIDVFLDEERKEDNDRKYRKGTPGCIAIIDTRSCSLCYIHW